MCANMMNGSPLARVDDMRHTFTAVFVDGEDGWIVGYIEELPGAVARGATMAEVEATLRQEAEVTLAGNRHMTWEPYRDAPVVKRGSIKVG